ncbi:MAG TPA: hypothetical protein VFA30_01265 [Gaiellaceae bacterium]|nr:hypothetical protein [Gaiellaceae bacterium]
MSTLARTNRRVARDADGRPRAAFADRALAAVPLTTAYLWLCIVYCVEAWKHATPWLFTDELEFTQISRSIADTGHPARRGQAYSFHSLYDVLTAPIWLIHSVATAYAGIKYFDVFLMTSVMLPTYLLARMVVRKPWALFAAVGASVIPSLAYSSWIVDETLAYPFAALCFWLIAKALVERTWSWIVPAVVASILAPAVRGELVVVPIVFLLALVFMWWSGDAMRERRRGWSWSDYLACFALAAGAVIVISGIAARHDQQWYDVTAYNWTKYRAFAYGDWAAGALATGLGAVPLAVGLAALVPWRGSPRLRELRTFRSVAIAGIVGFGGYTFMKASYLSQVFETRVEERNLIYIAPLLFVGFALVLDRRRVNWFALAAACAYVLYLVLGTPLQLGVQLYSDALGFAIVQQANRYYEWTANDARTALLVIYLVGIALVACAALMRSRRVPAIVLSAVAAVGILAWNLTGEVSAAAGSTSISRDFENILKRPFSWVDDTTGGKPTLYLGQGVADQRPEWLLEFWNRSIQRVSSLDGTIGGPGPSGAPNITPTGKVYWTTDPRNPGAVYDYAVEDWPCVDFAGTRVAEHTYGVGTNLKSWRLVHLTKPNRLLATCSGIYSDGWSGPNDSTYFRYAGRHAGWLRIRLSRQNWKPTLVVIQLGTISQQENSPILGAVRRSVQFTVPSGKTVTKWLRVPASGYAVHTVIFDKFIPRQVDPTGSSDPRLLGALVDYRFFTTKPTPRKAR